MAESYENYNNGSGVDNSGMGLGAVTKGGGVTKSQKLGSEMGAYTAVLSTLLGVGGTMHDIEMANKALMTNMGNVGESFTYGQNVQSQQLDDLDRVVGDKLSSSGLEALKNESTLKAAGAETGSSGIAVNEAVQTAGVNKLHRDAAILRTADVQKENKMNEMVASRLNFDNTIESMVSGQQDWLSAGLQTGSSALRGINMGMLMMSDASKENFFNDDTLFGLA